MRLLTMIAPAGSFLAATFATTLLAQGVASGDDPQELARACDRATGRSGGTERAANDPSEAIVVCTEARAAFPEDGRIANDLARALWAGGEVGAAREAFLAAQALGHPRAGLGLALLYREDNALPFGPADAIAPLEDAARAGVADAAYELGRAHAAGLGVEADAVRALQWYRRAAVQGLPQAQFELGWAAETGLGMDADPAVAAGWYHEAAEAGNLMAMNNLGWLHAQGEGVARDPARAVALYRAAAEGGEPVAMGNLAWMLENGIGTAQDTGEAARWYLDAANAGEAQAMLALGNLHLLGQGVARDAVSALRWFHRARMAGRAEALSYIGEVYEKSQAKHDPERAAAFYLRALKAGDGWPTSRMAASWEAETARALQRLLQAAGTYDGPIDGVIGTGSRAAMRAVMAAQDD
jgi:TPR repeat protein